MKLDRLIEIYENLTPASLPALAEVYAEDASFRDPFNDVQGLPAIETIFRHMFTQVIAPRFVIVERIVQLPNAFLIWHFHFRLGRRTFSVHGASHLRFNGAGKVSMHRDYWDAAEELYARLPLIGALMRFLQRRLSVANALPPARLNSSATDMLPRPQRRGLP